MRNPLDEKLEVYNLDNKLIGKMSRSDFYSETETEFTRTGKITRKVKTIRLILLNSKGRIYLQKRSKVKDQNTGLYDKTVGGHVGAKDSFDMTLIRECAEELGFPAAIVSCEDFPRAIIVTDLSIVGIFKKVEHISDFESIRIDGSGQKFNQPLMNTFYFGYYDGPIRFKDGESSGIEVFSIDELESEFKDKPEKFTEDIKFMFKRYKHLLKPIK